MLDSIVTKSTVLNECQFLANGRYFSITLLELEIYCYDKYLKKTLNRLSNRNFRNFIL